MKLCGDTLTIISGVLDQVTDTTVYTHTVITGISWYGSVKTSVGDTGLKSANTFTIRIPANADFGGKSYVDPGSYPAADPAACFTLRQGDTIVKGSVAAGLTPGQVHKMYPDMSFTILGVTDNRRAPNAPHWKVVGA